MDRCFSPVLAARTSQWLVLPTPGVPVIIILGCVLGIIRVEKENWLRPTVIAATLFVVVLVVPQEWCLTVLHPYVFLNLLHLAYLLPKFIL